MSETTPSRFIRMSALLGVLLVSACSQQLKPFRTDGCSAFPDGTFTEQELWLGCCTAHDLAYWQGGTRAQREQADQELKSCVANVGEEEIAALMLAGVRVGGSPYWPTPFRWGYGWPYPKRYSVLSAEQQRAVDVKLQSIAAE